MNDDRFDNIIRSKLENFQSSAGSDWEALLSRVKENPYLDDDAFDDRIREELQFESFIIPPANWDRMASYRYNKYITRQIAAIKAGELLALLLCFFTLFNYGLWPDHVQENPQLANHAAPADFIETGEAEPYVQGKDAMAALPGAEMNSGLPVDYSGNEKIIIPHNHLQSSHTSSAGLGGMERSENVIRENYEKHPQALRPLPTLHQRALASRGPGGVIGGPKLTGDLTLNISLPDPKDAYGPALGSWFGIYAGINNNTIKSPRDEVYNVSEKVLYTPGVSITGLFSRRLDNVEWAAGVSYSRISYAPYPIRETYRSEEGINVVSLDNIRYDILSLPVSWKWHMIRNNDWSLFAGIGIQPGLVVNEDYRITDRLDVPLPAPESAKGSAEYRSKLSEKEFTRAVFNGGRFSENVFLHGQLHLGVERRLGEKTILSLNTEYAHHILSPLGPNNDKIFIFSFGAGLKYKM